MKKFKFKLESLKRIRYHKTQEWEMKLAQASSVCQSIKNQIDERDKAKLSTINKLSNALRDDLAYFQFADLYISRLNAEKKQLYKDLQVAEEKRKKILATYTEVLREYKVMEKLEEKQYAVFRKEYKKHEVNLLDEANVTRS